MLNTPATEGGAPSIGDRLDWWDTYWSYEPEDADTAAAKDKYRKALRQDLVTYFKRYYEIG